MKETTLIKNILKSAGYYFAEIDTKSILNEKQNSIKIIYDINLGKKAKINFLPLQQGDVPDTYASTDNLKKKFNYQPSISVIDGISQFVKWYKNYYQI